MQNNYESVEYAPGAVIARDAAARSRFITRTYLHLFGAIAGFTLIEFALFASGIAEAIAGALGQNWLLVLGGFILVSWMASSVAHRVESRPLQYAALAAFVAAEAIIFVPLLYIADAYGRGGVIESAALVTMVGFVGLTAIAVYSGKDFSFLGAVLRWIGFAALLAIASALIFGFALGTWFSVGMVALAGASILYDTSKILRSYPEDRYVGAALSLFASVALMFWYVLRLFLSRD